MLVHSAADMLMLMDAPVLEVGAVSADVPGSRSSIVDVPVTFEPKENETLPSPIWLTARRKRTTDPACLSVTLLVLIYLPTIGTGALHVLASALPTSEKV